VKIFSEIKLPDFKVQKSDLFKMPLIEEKIGIGSAGVYPDIRCARCVNVAPVARNVSRHDATKPQRSQRLFIIARPYIENNMLPLPFSRDQEF
jgi:hypothetical protein